jgi:hypothetical protein
MIIEIHKPLTKSKIQKISKRLADRKSKKKVFNPDKYFNTIKWQEKPAEIQTQMRNEWK